MAHGNAVQTITHCNSLTEIGNDVFSFILANPPFAGAIAPDTIAPELPKTKKTELLFLALIPASLNPGGRAAVIVPAGVLFGSTRAHKALRKALVEEYGLDAVISMSPDAFDPYTNVRTALLIFGCLDDGAGADEVWFCDTSSPDEITPTRWQNRRTGRSGRNGASFVVPRQEIAENDYALTFNRYQEFVFETPDYDPPEVILDEILRLEDEARQSLLELKAMLAECSIGK